MVSALFTALALIAAGQGGSIPASSAGAQLRGNTMTESATPMPAGDRAVARKARRNG
jgi:hypothetical protein